jgi:uncharacterized membrane protein YidH (DUF202 family)
VPVPRIAVVLAAVGVALEFVGFLTRVSGAPRELARPLAMDAMFSVPRLYVTALFTAAAVVAALGAGRLPGRRTWWTAVAAIAAGIAAVKFAGDLHHRFFVAIGGGTHPVRALLVSAVPAGAVVGWLWWLSRHERRDRRRVLSCLGLYACAAVGLSSVSAAVGPPWAAAGTFVEESGEALAGVAFLIAVLLGVAPRLVLPADWPLRRTADAETVDAPGALPGRVISPDQLRW